MDKRSLLFVVCVSVALFVVNAFFSFREDGQKREKLQHQEIQKAKKLTALKADVEKRTATLSELDSVFVYGDVNEKDFLTAGVKLKNGVLTLAWKSVLPKQVFVDGKTYHLENDSVPLGDPVFYFSSSDKSVEVGGVPSQGALDLQLIEFHPDQKRPIVRLGVWKEGVVSIPLYERLDSHAIALVKQGGEYLPFGVYEVTSKSIIPLKKFKNISATLVESKQFLADKEVKEQRFYVLENETMQLVFSNQGGAVAEINLPFKSEENPESVVLPVELDREMESDYPYNDRFPAHPYYAPDGSRVEKLQLGGYFPLLRRDIFDPDGKVVWKIAPKHYAFNVVSEYPEVANLIYEVKEYDEEHIVFEATQQQRRITKSYRLPKPEEALPYLYEVDVVVEGDNRGLWLNSGIPTVDLMSENANNQLKYRMLKDGKVEVKTIDLPKDLVRIGSDQPIWVSNASGFFGLIMNPVAQSKTSSFGPMGFRVLHVSGNEAPPPLVLVDSEYQRYLAKDFPGYEVQVPLVEADKAMSFRMYAGPYNQPTLKEVDSALQAISGSGNPEFAASQSFHGWFSFISEPFAKFLLVLMKMFYSFTHSWAASIVLLTFALRVMLFPLNNWSMKSMKRMQKISPKVQEIQKKYKKEPRKAQLEVMGLYRQYGVNPLGGCFPLLIQMPFLIGMFDLLRSTFQLRGAIFIPGWIDNLAAPDVVFSWNYPIPFIGTSFHLLPILLGVVMFLQQKMTSSLPKDRSLWTDQQRQQKVMGNVMTLVFAVLFYRFPSGLNLYWLSSMLLGILQQWYINKRVDKEPLKPKNPSSKGGGEPAWAKRLQKLSR